MSNSSIAPWLIQLDRCPSTNTWAIDHAAELDHGAVVFTRQQTAGRGQYGRVWHSPAGVLTASFVLDRLPLAQLPGLSLAAGLAVIWAIEDLLPALQDQLRLKWANDVFVNDRKIAGILCETTSGQSSRQARVVVGVGLNRCVDFAEPDAAAIGDPVSLNQISAQIPDELALLARLRDRLLEVADLLSDVDRHPDCNPGGFALLLPELRCRDFLGDRNVTLDLAGEAIVGRAAGIDESGQLRLRLPNGEVRAFSSGRVRWT